MDKAPRPATRGYIEQAARRYDTAMAAAFRRALGIESTKGKRRRRGRHNASRKRYEPTSAELEACRKQKHGVVWNG